MNWTRWDGVSEEARWCEEEPEVLQWTVGQWSAGLSLNQGVGGLIPALVDVSLSKTPNPKLLAVAVSTVYECNRIVSRFG